MFVCLFVTNVCLFVCLFFVFFVCLLVCLVAKACPTNCSHGGTIYVRRQVPGHRPTNLNQFEFVGQVIRRILVPVIRVFIEDGRFI